MPKYFKSICDNRRAGHDYSILETFQAGIVLEGTEVKSSRQGKVNLKDSFGRIENGGVWIYGMHITPYKEGNRYNPEETRPRKLLLTESEIKKITGRVAEKGLTIVPLKMYFSGNWAKLEIGIAKAKKTYEKRDVKRLKDLDKEAEREFKLRNE